MRRRRIPVGWGQGPKPKANEIPFKTTTRGWPCATYKKPVEYQIERRDNEEDVGWHVHEVLALEVSERVSIGTGIGTNTCSGALNARGIALLTF